LTTFSLLLACASVLGLSWMTLHAPARQRSVTVQAGMWVLAGALVGARAACVGVHWAYYQGHIGEVLQMWAGGFSWPGALAGGLLALILAAWCSEVSLAHLADRMLPLLACLSVALWLGCWLTGCAYGPVTKVGLPARDEWGLWQNRLPLQLSAALLTAALFWGIERFRQTRWGSIPGLAASLGWGGLSLILLGASVLRADPCPLWRGVRLETWAAIFFVGLSGICGVLAFLRRRSA